MWSKVRARSYCAEYMDAPDFSKEALWANLTELEHVNRLLGGYRATLKGLESLGLSRQRTWRIIDVGCGGGDTLRVVKRWAEKKGYRFELMGCDLNPDCIAYAQAQQGSETIQWHVGSYQTLEAPCDIVLSALFTHHLDEIQLRHFLSWMRQNARYGFVINDLHRHFLAYYSISALGACLSASAAFQHDAPLSVWRGFRAQDLQQACQDVGLRPFINWTWAFRWCVWGYA